MRNEIPSKSFVPFSLRLTLLVGAALLFLPSAARSASSGLDVARSGGGPILVTVSDLSSSPDAFGGLPLRMTASVSCDDLGCLASEPFEPVANSSGVRVGIRVAVGGLGPGGRSAVRRCSVSSPCLADVVGRARPDPSGGTPVLSALRLVPDGWCRDGSGPRPVPSGVSSESRRSASTESGGRAAKSEAGRRVVFSDLVSGPWPPPGSEAEAEAGCQGPTAARAAQAKTEAESKRVAGAGRGRGEREKESKR